MVGIVPTVIVIIMYLLDPKPEDYDYGEIWMGAMMISWFFYVLYTWFCT